MASDRPRYHESRAQREAWQNQPRVCGHCDGDHDINDCPQWQAIKDRV